MSFTLACNTFITLICNELTCRYFKTVVLNSNMVDIKLQLT